MKVSPSASPETYGSILTFEGYLTTQYEEAVVALNAISTVVNDGFFAMRKRTPGIYLDRLIEDGSLSLSTKIDMKRSFVNSSPAEKVPETDKVNILPVEVEVSNEELFCLYHALWVYASSTKIDASRSANGSPKAATFRIVEGGIAEKMTETLKAVHPKLAILETPQHAQFGLVR